MNLNEIINDYDADYSKNCIDTSDISILESAVAMSFGEQLKEYLLSYGYLGYKFVELYGVNKNTMERSNMVKETLYLHTYFLKTKNLVAIEDQGDGEYYLIDDMDFTYRYISSIDELTPLNIKLFDYILERFKFVDEISKS